MNIAYNSGEGMNIAVIFAGGTGQRMNSRTKPKQFLLVHGKPIIIYTLEAFDQHPDIDAIVHDGVRPLIDQQTITDCIVSVKKNGSAVTVVPATETIVQSEDGVITNIIDRKQCQLARAPQCFRLGELHDAHHKAVEEGLGDFIDSASLMSYYGHKLYEVEGANSNIKITTPSDFYIMRAIMDAKASSQIFGL
jgi:2-C-methyl-D-erythritol 4-phosphate cytidylyltransferase